MSSHPAALTIISPDDGRRYRLHVRGDIARLSIGRLKQCLAAASCPIPAPAQLLKLSGVPLSSDGELCGVYGITAGATLTVEHQGEVGASNHHNHNNNNNSLSLVSPQRRALEYQTLREQEANLSTDIAASDNTLQGKIDALQEEVQAAERKKMDLEKEKNKAERELEKLREKEEAAEKERQRLTQLRQQETERAARRAADLAARREQLKAEEEATRMVALQKLDNERRKAMLEQQKAEYEAEKQRLEKERETYEQRAKEREIQIREKEIEIEQRLLAAERDKKELEMKRLVSHENRILYYKRVGVPPPEELLQTESLIELTDRKPSSFSFVPVVNVESNNVSRDHNKMEKLQGIGKVPVGLNLSGNKQQQQSTGLFGSKDNTPASAYPYFNTNSESFTSGVGNNGMMMPRKDNNTIPHTIPLYDAHQNAIDNLIFMGQELDLDNRLEFDSNNTCVINVDEQYTLLVTFDATTERLYLYSTILTSIPKNSNIRLQVYEFLMEAALLGREMCGGGIGASLKNDFILLSTSIYLPTSHPTTLSIITPNFILTLKKWREKLQIHLDSIEGEQYEEEKEEFTTIYSRAATTGVKTTTLNNPDIKGQKSNNSSTRIVQDQLLRRPTISTRSTGTLSTESRSSSLGVGRIIGIEATDSVIVNGVISKYNDGVMVLNVTGPAANAGMQPNDFIKKVNNKRVTSLQQFQRDVSRLSSGTMVSFVVERSGLLLVVPVKTSLEFGVSPRGWKGGEVIFQTYPLMQIALTTTMDSSSRDSSSISKNEIVSQIPLRDRSAMVTAREEDVGVVGIVKSSTVVSSSSVHSPPQRLNSTYINSSIFAAARRRFILLAALLALQSGSQVVLQRYEKLIKKHVVIVLFMSMVVGAGGNAGNQAAVAVITALLATRANENHLEEEEEEEEELNSSTHEAGAGQRPHTSSLFILHRNKNNNISRLLYLLRLPRVLFQQLCRRLRGNIGSGRGHRLMRLSLGIVLRYEILVGLCCAVILMSIGGLRVGLFLWMDDDDDGDDNINNNNNNIGLNGIGGGNSKSALSLWSLLVWSNNVALVVALSLSLFLIVFSSVVIGTVLPYVLLYFDFNIEHAAPIVQVLMDLIGTWLCCVTCNALLPYSED